MSDAKVKITIETNNKEVEATLKRVAKSYSDTEGAARKATGVADKGQRGVNQRLSEGVKQSTIFKGALQAALTSQVIVAGIKAITNGLRSIAGGLVESTKLAAEKQQIQQRLASTLEITGRTTEGLSQRLIAFGAEIQKTTRFTGDQTVESLSLLATLTDLDEKGLQTATKAAMDMSIALGIDLRTATQLVGRAANGEIGALSRYGLQIEKGKDNAETFANVLDTLGAKMGGAAERDVQTFSGAMAQLQNELNDTKAALGAMIINSEGLQTILRATTDALSTLQGVFAGTNETFNEWSGTIKFAGIFLASFVSVIGGAAVATKLYAAAVSLAVPASTAFALGTGATTASVSAYAIAAGIAAKVTAVLKVAMLALPMVAIAAGIAALVTSVVWLYKNFDKAQLAVVEFFMRLFEYAVKAESTLRRIFGADPEAGKLAKGLEALGDRADLLRQKIDSANQAQVEQSEVAGEAAVQAAKKVQEVDKKQLAEKQKHAIAMMELEAQMQQLALEERLLFQESADKQTADLELARQNDLLMRKREAEREALVALEGDRQALDAIRQQNRVAQAQRELDLKKKQADQEVKTHEDMNKRKKEVEQRFWADTTSLMRSSSKKLFKIGQAASIAQASMSMYEGANKALAQGGVLGPVFAAAVVAAGMVNIQRIATQKAPAFQDGGIVPGQSFSGDRVIARVNSGEMILNQRQQAQLFDMANKGGGGETVIHTAVNVDGETIARAVSRRVADGMILGESV